MASVAENRPVLFFVFFSNGQSNHQMPASLDPFSWTSLSKEDFRNLFMVVLNQAPAFREVLRHCLDCEGAPLRIVSHFPLLVSVSFTGFGSHFISVWGWN